MLNPAPRAAVVHVGARAVLALESRRHAPISTVRTITQNIQHITLRSHPHSLSPILSLPSSLSLPLASADSIDGQCFQPEGHQALRHRRLHRQPTPLFSRKLQPPLSPPLPDFLLCGVWTATDQCEMMQGEGKNQCHFDSDDVI